MATDRARVAVIETDIARILSGRDNLLYFQILILKMYQEGHLSEEDFRIVQSAHDDALEAIKLGHEYAKQMRGLAGIGKLSD